MKVFNQKQLAIALMGLGALPFAVLTLLMAIPRFNLLPTGLDPAFVLHGYAVVIASFVAGLQWGIHFCKRTGDSVYLFTSVVALMLWLSLWSAGSIIGLAIALLGFILLWAEEYRFSVQRVTTAWFWQARSIVSACVCGCLVVAILIA